MRRAAHFPEAAGGGPDVRCAYCGDDPPEINAHVAGCREAPRFAQVEAARVVEVLHPAPPPVPEVRKGSAEGREHPPPKPARRPAKPKDSPRGSSTADPGGPATEEDDSWLNE